REKLEHRELCKKVVSHAKLWNAVTVLIEKTTGSLPLIQELYCKKPFAIIPIKPEGNKVMRMSAQSDLIEAGRVFLPKDAHWLPEFQKEMVTFPKGKHDDQVDSVSQFLAWSREKELVAAYAPQTTVTLCESEPPDLSSIW
ncbi:MAG TPA: hypothetical protein EYO59_10925, partial [Chromatiaceae bacterium]|nr:hypothetical protein [Chromatiaceae bacterium]